VSGVSREPVSVGIAAAGHCLMSARLMIALELGLVQLIEDRRRVVGIPDRDVFLEVASNRQFAKVAIDDLGIAAWRRLN
jgi:hypothetical protein